MVGPNPLKIFKPKTHEWIGLRVHETKGRKKKAQPAKITRDFSDKNWAGIPRDCRELGVLGTCSRVRMRLR